MPARLNFGNSTAQVHPPTRSFFLQISFWRFGYQESPENEGEVEDRFVQVEAIATKLYNDNNPSQGFVFDHFVILSDSLHLTAFVFPQLGVFGFGGSETRESEARKLQLYLEGGVSLAYYHLGYSLFNFRKQKQIVGSHHVEAFALTLLRIPCAFL